LKYSPFTTVEKTATIVRNKLNIFEDIDGIEFVRKESNKQPLIKIKKSWKNEGNEKIHKNQRKISNPQILGV
jgi:hypothetical protein